MKQASFHEDLRREYPIQGATDRNFGVVAGTACVLIGATALWFGRGSGWWWAGIGTAALMTAFARPKLLRPLNFAWLKLGLLLFAITNPVVMAILYYLCVVPMGFTAKALGKDLLRLKRDPETATYWTTRDHHAASPESMRNQF